MKRIFIMILLVPFSSASAADGQPRTATLSWRDTQGNVQSIGLYKGKIVVLNFWATWCVPCQHEMPMLAEMQRKYADQGVVVLGASLDDASSQPKILPFAVKDNVPFPLLVGVTTDEMQHLQLGEAIPATAFFDADGKLVGRVLGELNKSELQHRIEWMLGKHHGKEPPAFVNGFLRKVHATYETCCVCPLSRLECGSMVAVLGGLDGLISPLELERTRRLYGKHVHRWAKIKAAKKAA